MSAVDSSIKRGMARIRKVLEKRMRIADRKEELAARAPKPIRRGALAAYDTAGLARKLRPMLEFDGRGWRLLAEEIGVTAPDLSRVMAGQDIAAGKVFAICDWAGLDARAFYRPAAAAPKPRKRPRRVPKMFHGKSTETVVAPAREYDAAADAVGSYYAAIEAKRQRGDTHWTRKPAP